MRYITWPVIASTFAVLFSSTVSAQSESGGIVGAGALSCEQMLSHLSEVQTEAAEVVYQAWVHGYLSGLNILQFYMERNNANVVDGGGNWLWVQNYCRNNPLEDVAQATIELFNELKSRQGIE